MRTLDAGFAAHVESGATTLATCWRLIRTDGVVMGFTDHDVTLNFDGTDFSPRAGFDGSEIASRLGPEIDTSEVVGVIAGEAITEADIRLGRYGRARVETWRVNWRDTSVRHLVRADTIGEIVEEDGVFRAELRSAHAALNVVRGRLYHRSCDAELGDTRCGVDLDDPANWRDVTVAEVIDRHFLLVTGLGDTDPGWSAFGTIAWTTGARTGFTDRIAQQARDDLGDRLGLEADLRGAVAAGDTGRVSAGCDKQFSTCKAKFANADNFRGFPHIPGTDFILKYPKRGDRLDGQALFS
ncbi:MAG: DUF2163 domain-containing protein [Cucumibacter sp.]